MIVYMMEFIFILLSVLLASGFFTLFERKVMGSVQLREGPVKVLTAGVLQPLSDAFKLFMKTSISSEMSIDLLYFFSPFMSFLLSLLCWVVIPVDWGLKSWYSGMLFIMFCFSVSIYGLIFSGWFSRSKFASLGCIRALSQSVSFEVPLTTGLLVFMLIYSTVSFKEVGVVQEIVYHFFPFCVLFVVMEMIFLAEMNRAPFDLAEGESELVSGFSVELGGSVFIMVFLSEYVSLVWACFMMSILFLGSMGLLMGMKILFFMFLFVLIRSSYPRIRLDWVMLFCWLGILPLVVTFLLMSINVLL